MNNYNDLVKLDYDKDLDAVIMEWTGFTGKEEFREANEEVLNLIRETGAKKIIGDLRNMKIINVNNQKWLYEDWLPRAVNEGLQYAALIESEDFFNRKSIHNVVEKMPENITIRYFKLKLAARSWIRSL